MRLTKTELDHLNREMSRTHGWGLILIAREQLRKWVLAKKPRKLLDIGCHNRHLEQTVREWYSSVETFGLDITVYQVKPDVLASGDHLPFRGSTFDFVTMIEVLEHIVDYVRALREVLRVLRPGGTLFVQSVSCLSQHAYEGDETHFHVLHPKTLSRLARVLGFKVLETGMVNLTLYAVFEKPRLRE